MTAFTDSMEDRIIDNLFRTATASLPASLYFAYATAVPDGDAGTFTEVLPANNYAREAVTRNVTNFVRTNQQIKNDTEIAFNVPSGGAWGIITHWGIFDQATDGTLLAYGPLDASKDIQDGSPAPVWPIGAFTFNFNYTTNYLANLVADWFFIGTAFAKPSSLSFDLFTVSPTTSTNGTKVSGGSYDKVGVTPLNANFDATVGGNGVTANSNVITFPPPTANWGDVVAGGIFDAATSNLLTYDSFSGVTINNDDAAPLIAVGNFTFTVG